MKRILNKKTFLGHLSAKSCLFGCENPIGLNKDDLLWTSAFEVLVAVVLARGQRSKSWT
jgi:hypothetical protein